MNHTYQPTDRLETDTLFYDPSDDSQDVTEETDEMRSMEPVPPLTNTSQAVVRVPGGRSAVAKRITDQLDTEDQMIFDMKRQGTKDVDIVQKLIKEGMTRYKPASITSRYIRIKNKMQEATDELLDEELTDWHEGEDYVLLQAYAKADERIMAELQKVREKRFAYVSEIVNNVIERPRFSSRACRMRYNDLQDGTARPPPELDDDPEARRLEKAERKAAYAEHLREEKLREQEEADAKVARSARGQAKSVAEERKAAREAEASAKRFAALQEKAIKQGNLARQRQQKNQAIQQYKDEEYRKSEKRRMESKLLATQLKMQGMAAVDNEARRIEQHAEQRRAAARAAAGYKNIPSLDEASRINAGARAATTTGPVGDTMQIATPTLVGATAGASLAAFRQRQQLRRGQTNIPPYAEEIDARLVMNRPEICQLTVGRNITCRRDRDTKEVLCRHLYNSDWSVPAMQLQTELHACGQPTGGSRPELIYRLVEFQVKSSKTFRPKHMVDLNRTKAHCDAAKSVLPLLPQTTQLSQSTSASPAMSSPASSQVSIARSAESNASASALTSVEDDVLGELDASNIDTAEDEDSEKNGQIEEADARPEEQGI